MSSAARGAALAAIAVLLGLAILRWGVDLQPNPVVQAGIATPSPTAVLPTAVPATGSEAVVVQPTVSVDTSTARPNNEVRVLVANGTDIPRQAQRLTDSLRNQNFNTQSPRTASPGQPSSVIWYRPGFEAEAAVVQQVLNTTTSTAPLPQPDPNIGEDIDISTIDVVVLIGADALSTN